MGTGDIEGLVHPDIEHLGFVQPDRLRPILLDGGVFILPSKIEPWAVVVQEYAAAGYPLMLSKNVGAREAFLIDNENGFSFEANSVDAIKDAFVKLSRLNAEQLSAMRKVSHELGIVNTPKQWVATLLSFMQ
jgi:glycosyltransferase involved in cell wall biosynthesis